MQPSAGADQDSGYHGVLTVSTKDTRTGQFPSVRYTRGPVTIPAGGQYTLRYSVVGRCIGTGGSLIYDELSLRVRVGWFTRTERVDFAGTSMVLTGTAASQAACSP